MLDTVVTDDGVECVLCVPRGRARQRPACSVERQAVFGAALLRPVHCCALQPLARYRHAPPRRLRVCVPQAYAPYGEPSQLDCQLSMRMSPSRDRRESTKKTTRTHGGDAPAVPVAVTLSAAPGNTAVGQAG